MKIDILITDKTHPVLQYLDAWKNASSQRHHVAIHFELSKKMRGDILFLISCAVKINTSIRSRYAHVVVLHASDLPKGRGWSPHIWAVLNNEPRITVCSLVAEDAIDTGDIWAKTSFEVAPSDIYCDINHKLFEAELHLLEETIRLIEDGETPCLQSDAEVSYFRKRTPADSELDPDMTLRDLFNTIRVCDPRRYPAFFDMHGTRYCLEIKKDEG